jgi:hypothetical protein
MPVHKRENIWLNIVLNVILPSLLLTKGAKWLALPPTPILITALSLPLIYGVYDYFARRKINIFSVIGFVSVLITGVIGLIEDIPTRWIAVKEAAVPFLFGLAIYISSFTKKPLIRALLFSKELFDVDLVEQSLEEKGTRAQFEKVISSCTLWVVASFMLSTVLNYILASWLVNSNSGTEAFNNEIGKMTALSWPVIVLPTTAVMMVALFKLMKGIETATGHELDEVLHPDVREKMAAKDAALQEKKAQKKIDKQEE